MTRNIGNALATVVAAGAASCLSAMEAKTETNLPPATVRLHFMGSCATAGTGEKTVDVRLVNLLPAAKGAPAVTARLEGTLRRDDGLVLSSRPSPSLDTLVFDVPEFGLYTLEAAALAADGATNAAASTSYAVVPPVAERPREFGTCVHFQQGKGQYPLTFDLLRLAGFSRVRDDLSWRYVETAPGRYRIPDAADALVSRCEEYGIEPLFVFGYANQACYPTGFQGEPFEQKNKCFPTDDATRRACADALAFAVRHFGARVPAWELWNEPNYADPVKDYLPLLKFAYPAVKAARPEAKLVSGGGRGPGGGIGGKFINDIFGAKAQDFQDGWSIHPYMAPHGPDHGYHAPKSGTIKVGNVEQSMRYLLSRADKNRRSDGKALELFVTEIGWTDAVIPEALQAAYLARAMLLFRRHAQGVPVFFYDFQNDGTEPGNKEQNFGMIRWDYSPKPSFQAIAVAASLLANRPFADALLDGDECRIYGYGANGRADFYAAWNVGKSWRNEEAPDEREVQVALPDGDWTLIDWQGRPLQLRRAPDGRATLTLSNLPSYLVRARSARRPPRKRKACHSTKGEHDEHQENDDRARLRVRPSALRGGHELHGPHRNLGRVGAQQRRRQPRPRTRHAQIHRRVWHRDEESHYRSQRRQP